VAIDPPHFAADFFKESELAALSPATAPFRREKRKSRLTRRAGIEPFKKDPRRLPSVHETAGW
jgi:hypothetical protein